jgi:hypothetical protein
VVTVTGGSNKRVSLAALIAVKPGCGPGPGETDAVPASPPGRLPGQHRPGPHAPSVPRPGQLRVAQLDPAWAGQEDAEPDEVGVRGDPRRVVSSCGTAAVMT